MRSAGLAVTWSRTGAPRPLAPAVSLAAYRIAQEALTNAAKHGSGTADLTTEWYDAGLTIRVANEAVPSGEPHAPDVDVVDEHRSAGHGLVGMRERATTNGGRLRAGPAAAGRFEVEAWLPATADREVGT